MLTQAGRLHKVIVYLVYCFMTSVYDSSSTYDSVIMSSIYMLLRRRETSGKVMVATLYNAQLAPNNLKVSVLR